MPAASPSSKPRKRRPIIIVFLIVVLLVGMFPFVAGALIKPRLQRRLAQQFGGTVQIDLLIYWPPHTLIARNVHWTDSAHRPRLSADAIHLDLAVFPAAGHPLQIDRLTLGRPTFTLVPSTLPTTQPAGVAAAVSAVSIANIQIDQGTLLEQPENQSAPTSLCDHLQLTLATPNNADYTLTASAAVPALHTSLATLFAKGSRREQNIVVHTIQADTQGAQFELTEADLSHKSGSWQAHLPDAHLSLPGWPHPLDLSGADFQLAGSQLTFKNVVVHYAQDTWQITSADMSLPQARLQNIIATARFDRPGISYPGYLGDILNDLHPSGEFTFKGSFAPSDFRLHIASSDAGFDLTQWHIPLAHARGDAIATPLLIDIPSVAGELAAGQFTTSVKLDRPTTSQPWSYQGQAVLRDVNTEQIAALFRAPQSTQTRLSGRGYAKSQFQGQVAGTDHLSPIRTLRLTGEAEIFNGNFWDVPLLHAMLTKLKLSPNATHASQAAAIFQVADRQITVEKLTVDSDLLGLQGDGKANFDRAIQLDLVAIPLGDWRAHMKRAHIPLISDVAAELVGGVQKLLATATSQLLYEFKVTGTMNQPNIVPVPTPVLTQSGKVLFAHMARAAGDSAYKAGDLLNDTRLSLSKP